ncbi:hypothetical protein J3R83DRAFT_7748, partial [Lanmaoa asiatica]
MAFRYHVSWGIIMMLMGLVKTYSQIVGVRFCLGFADAGLFPGVVYYLTLWYPRHMLQYRVDSSLGQQQQQVKNMAMPLCCLVLKRYMGDTGRSKSWSWIF